MADKLTTKSALDHLTMDLFSPGMSALHRAGLGGLACTLKAMERQHENGLLAKSSLPAPFLDSAPPWDTNERSVTLRFGKSENAAGYLQRLFEFAFAIRKDGLILLPGQHHTEPAAPLLADLQSGLTLTFLQHGKVRQLTKESKAVSYDPEGDGVPGVVLQYRQCTGFKHQEGWRKLVDKKANLVAGTIKVDGPISPGAVVRHVAFTGDTAAGDPPERMLPLYFALVGCLALPVNRGVAVLLVPEVTNLLEFTVARPLMTPTNAREAQVANAADAAFQAHVRLRARAATATTKGGCDAMTFTPTPWASQQKSRVATIHVSADDEVQLDRFARALAYLPTRIVVRVVTETTGRGKQKKVSEHREAFRGDSVIRPMIAENLALGRKWYAGFTQLMTRNNPATDKPYRQHLSFERKGLNEMISDPGMWDKEGETLVVRAVHEAIRQSLGRIREETDGKSSRALSQATKNRWERFRELLRLDLAGAKTHAKLRFVLSDLFSRGGSNSVLREAWDKVLPVIRCDWQLARDLGLLALASYSGRGGNDADLDTNSIN